MMALVERARAGDEAAFARLVARCYDRVYRWALGRTGDPDEADDVTQDVLVRMHRHLGGYRGRAQFTTWLYQITRNAAIDRARRRERRMRTDEHHIALAEPRVAPAPDADLERAE